MVSPVEIYVDVICIIIYFLSLSMTFEIGTNLSHFAHMPFALRLIKRDTKQIYHMRLVMPGTKQR